MTSQQCLSAAVLTLMFGTTLSAQLVVQTQFSAGGVAILADTEQSPLGGWYVDAMQAIGWSSGFVAEASGFYAPEQTYGGSPQWFAGLVGLRQRLRVARSGTAVYGQFLVGVAQELHRFTAADDLLAFQPGLLIDVPMNERWGLRVRTDVRVGVGLDGDSGTGGLSAGFGVNRYWGRR